MERHNSLGIIAGVGRVPSFGDGLPPPLAQVPVAAFDRRFPWGRAGRRVTVFGHDGRRMKPSIYVAEPPICPYSQDTAQTASTSTWSRSGAPALRHKRAWRNGVLTGTKMS